MDVFSLKSHIIDNPELIELILENTGFHYITPMGKEYRCARESGRNPTSVKVNIETLGATCFSTNLKGDIITLVQSKLGITFPKTIKKICKIIDYEFDNKIETFSPPFGGYYKNIAKLKNDDLIDLDTYEDSVLDQYEKVPNLLFYEDGILPEVQSNYNIGYDSASRRITVPWYSFNGEICGVMGRLNKKDVEDTETKWFPVIPFPKSKTLYGFVNNYNSMQERDMIMIGESEKHSLQLASKGLNVGLSLGGSFMSEIQANHIKSLFTENILIMMDEGLGEEHSVDIAEKVKFNNFFKNKVGYIFDKHNHYLQKDSKLAPSDLDTNSLKLLINNCTKWI
ncbi:hypothetical protein QU593_10365 [Rossellomorea marisflavi]|uniref:hypothetical protein n=1 Tax=Rossellomorea marisflavi TaxID=189381 RepID=UPI0025B1CAED|nr:hypothetical protein [Rossellomorea marisflavi]WJV20809.1 hypothetical protein QU593_10365 [Rossellomorea marisflavi]